MNIPQAKLDELQRKDAKIKEMLLQGKRTMEIVRAVDTNNPRVLKIRKQLIDEGYNIAPPKTNAETSNRKEELKRLYYLGHTGKDISKIMGVSQTWVYNTIQSYVRDNSVMATLKCEQKKAKKFPEDLLMEWDDVTFRMQWYVTTNNVLCALRRKRSDLNV